MKLRFVGAICPDCGEISGIDEWYGPQPRRRTHSGWSGYYYTVTFCCGIYLILFDENRRFVGVVPNHGHTEESGILVGGGERQRDVDEIPF